ncbi:MAG: ABC transporter substrate-binding protein [Nocardioides sp.]
MTRVPRGHRAVLAVSALTLALAGCAPEENPDSNIGGGSDPSGDSTEFTEATSCAVQDLNLEEPGKLTVATDSPAFPPWFEDDDPTNGKGFESAVTYALAEEMGFAREDVQWVKVKFNNSYKPGEKNFDFDINQISITPERQKVVDFSIGYYAASQAAIALKGTEGAEASSLADLKGLRLGAQTGTTSLTAIRDVIEPDTEPLVFRDTNAAKQAMQNDQVDVILADLPTAFYITAVEIPKASIIGQFQPQPGQQSGQTEEFGLLLEKGNPLKECLDFYLEGMKESGELAGIEKQWLSDTVGVPELQ